LYLVANHHTAQFDAWNINPDCTATYQFKVNLSYATDPAGIGMDESSNTLFISSEFSLAGLEMVDATTMTSVGKSDTGVTNCGGVEVDDANDIVYTIKRAGNTLYAYDWDPVAKTLTLKAGFPKTLPGCSGGYGIALDETAGILWVADGYGNKARAYDTGTWNEDTTKSFTPSHKPIDIAVDRQRGFVYTVSMSYGAGGPGGSNLLSKYDLATSTETTVNLGHQGVGLAVEEIKGCVYVTGDSYARKLEVWDTSTSPWTQVQVSGVSGSPAGICIPQEEVAYNPLNLAKTDGLAPGDCVNAGDNITYTISYDNTQNQNPVNNVTIVDTLPPETNYVSDSGGGIYNAGTHTVTWNIGTLPGGDPGGSIQLVVQVDPSTTLGITITDYCTIDSDETPKTTVTEQTDICVSCPPADLWAVEYRYGAPPPGYDMSGWPLFKSWLEVRIENQGSGDAENVIATINNNKPLNVTILPDPEDRVALGDIPAGGSAWSSGDTFTLIVDMANPSPDPMLGIHWNIEYDDECGNHHVVLDVPEFPWCPGGPSFDQMLPVKRLWYPQVTVSKLYPNYPNPFNPETWMPYQIVQDADVTVRIFDTRGQLIKTIAVGRQEAGFYISKNRAAYWDGRNQWGESVSSGVYFYTLEAGQFAATRKMVILK
jgi:uncharacterized repeat protein (TIGR01451 family)